MKIRLLTAVKARANGGGFTIIHPGIYDTESETFPVCLQGESRPSVIQFMETPAEMPGFIKESDEEGLDPDDDDNSDLPIVEEEVEEEVVKPKKGKLKRRN